MSGKHIFLFDRGYPSYDLFSKLITHQLFFLMRLPSSFKNLINMEKEDVLVQYQPKDRKLSLPLRCIHKPEIIKQDFYSTVFVSNLSALIKNMADTHLKSNVQNKHKYQVNRNFIIGREKRNIIFLARKRDTVSDIISKIIKESVKNLSLIRPGRQCSCTVKKQATENKR